MFNGGKELFSNSSFSSLSLMSGMSMPVIDTGLTARFSFLKWVMAVLSAIRYIHVLKADSCRKLPNDFHT
jgi:hypothetical protein